MIVRKFLPTQRSKTRCFLLIVLMLFLYMFDNSSIKNLIDNRLYNNLLKPLILIGLGYLAWSFPAVSPKGRLKLRSFLNTWSFSFAVIYIIVSVMAGLIDGFGRSPYSQTPKGIIMNIIYIGTALVAGELIRNYLINNLTDDKENFLIFTLIALFMTVTNISFSRFTRLKDYQDIVKFIAEFFAPQFSQNLLASYLVFLGGPRTSILYLGLVEAFHWLSPILPNLKWITRALIGILCPIFCLMSLQSMYLEASKQLKRNSRNEEGLLSWIITSIVSIAIIWFSVGVFPIYPSVIATGSMEPMIKPGDVILVEKVKDMKDINSLKTGDVIQFKRDAILISHRITEIIDDGKQKSYRTKGDNNSSEDIELVMPEQVKGKIAYVIPKIGWPTLLMKSKQDIPLDDIVF